VLSQVRNGVWIEDPPTQLRKTSQCVTTPGATQRTCATPVTAAYVNLVRHIEAMLIHTHHRFIPTLQWFCAEGICPSVIDHTLTTHDGDHLTMNWSADLGPLLAPEIRRVLAR